VRAFREKIEAWEMTKHLNPNDEFLQETCKYTIRKLKIRNFIFDIIDVFLKALGLLAIMGGIITFFFSASTGSIFSLLLSAATIYYGFKIAKGLEK